MRYLICSCPWILLVALLWAPPAPAAKPSADEFAAPLQAATEQSRSIRRGSGQVRMVKDSLTGGQVLQGRTAQAAIAAAVGQSAAGCRMIRFGDGFGWVATGTAPYPASENPVALRRFRQDARFKAFTDAVARLTGCLAGVTSEARQRITEILERNDAVRLALINLAFTDTDKREQAVRILTRGFVAYSVEDDPNQRMVYVNLVATPKTATRLTRPAPGAVEAASLQEGLRQAQAEIRAGVIPPMGNRLIVVNATGEVALVGYAINLIGAHPNPAAQDKLRSDAGKIATRRATEALMGLATGDDSAWQNGLDEASRSDIQLLNSGYGEGEPSVIRFTQIRDLVMSSISNDPGMEALREGRLPTAVAIRSFGSEDTVAVMATYTPPVKKREPKPSPPSATPASRPAGGIPATPVKPATTPDNAPPPSGTAPSAPPPAPPTSEAQPVAPRVEPPPAPPAPSTEPLGDKKLDSPPGPSVPTAEPSGDQGATGGSKPAEAR